jgi:hypothetical protein
MEVTLWFAGLQRGKARHHTGKDRSLTTPHCDGFPQRLLAGIPTVAYIMLVSHGEGAAVKIAVFTHAPVPGADDIQIST